MITIFITTPLRRFAGEQSKVGVSGNTVARAIESLTNLYPSLVPYIYDESNAIRKHVRIYLGDDDIRDKEGIETPLKDGDEISIIPAIAGGKV